MRHWFRTCGAIGLILAAQLLSAGAGAEKREPLTEVDVIDLLKGGVSQERVGKLAREFGIAFEVTSGVEQDLRTAGASDQLLETLRGLRPETQKEKKEAGKTDSPGAQTGILLISVDAPCKLSVDGESEGELTAGTPKRVSVAFGDHLIHAESTEDASLSVEWTGKVETTQQQLLQLHLAEKLAQAAAARKAEEAERTRQSRLKEFSDIIGKWTRTYTDPHADMAGLFSTWISFTYEQEIELRPEGLHDTNLEGTFSSVLVSCSFNTKLCRNSLGQKGSSPLVLSHNGPGEYQGTFAPQTTGSQAIHIKLTSPDNLEYSAGGVKSSFTKVNP